MQVAANMAAILLIIVGGVWMLQGINVLPGSFMTGQTKWAIYGAISLTVGTALLLVSKSRR